MIDQAPYGGSLDRIKDLKIVLISEKASMATLALVLHHVCFQRNIIRYERYTNLV